ncbi:MAG: arginase family protein [Paracoccaceae bacterium]
MATFGEMIGAGPVTTFFGLPRVGEAGAAGAGIVLLGVPMATPYPSVGPYCAAGPAAIRDASADYGQNFTHVNFDLGGAILPPGRRAADAGMLAVTPADPAANRRRIRAAVGQVLAGGAVPFVIGGDDSVQIPMLEAYGDAGRKIAILQIDAHIDWRDEIGGERWGLSSTQRRASEMPHVGAMVQVGARGIGSARAADADAARARGVSFVTAREVAREGFARAVGAVPEGSEVVICLDLDALDPSVMPGVIGRTAGGLGYWQVVELIAGVAARARIAGFGMVEFMPERDVDGLGALTAAQLLAAAMGVVARQG